MAVIKPDDVMRRKRELIEKILRDLSPGLRDHARRLLEEKDLEFLGDREKVLEYLRRKGIII